MLGALWLFDRGSARSAFMAGVSAALSALLHFTSLFTFVYFATDAFFSGLKFRRLFWLTGGAVVAMAPYLAWTWWNYGNPFYTFAFASRITTEWTAPVPAGCG